jgi:hypothetical protein
MRFLISQKYDGNKVKSGTVEDCIDVYEDRVKGWSLGPARALTKVPNSSFAILTIVLSYFEGYAILHGCGNSKHQMMFFQHRLGECLEEVVVD